MGQPLISALVNTYNHGPFIEEAIESVLSQQVDGSGLEVIVVDDGSTDDTGARVQRFGDRVRYFSKANCGQCSAVNLGFEHARGDIIALLDGDDAWLPGKLSRIVELFERNPDAGLLLHKRLVYDARNHTTEEDPDLPVLSGAFPVTGVDLLAYGTTSTSAMAFRRRVAAALFPIPGTMTLHADSYLQALLIFLAPVIILNESLTKYRLHENNFFCFASGDDLRVQYRLTANREFVKETGRWLENQGFIPRMPCVVSYLKRFELIEQETRFLARGATRLELYRHLKLHREVYGPVWSVRFRMYRWLMNYAALFLGYRKFEMLRRLHGRGGGSLHLRRWLFPAHPAEPIPS